MRVNNRRKNTISLKMFITEFGDQFSENVTKRLMDLDLRCVLTRSRESYNILDLKHVEHTKYDDENKLGSELKEYCYAEFAVIEGELYFSEKCMENEKVMKSSVVDKIYNHLSDDNMTCEGEKNFKKVEEDNIDYIVDNIILKCPQVSQKYIDIVNEMTSLAERK